MKDEGIGALNWANKHEQCLVIYAVQCNQSVELDYEKMEQLVKNVGEDDGV